MTAAERHDMQSGLLAPGRPTQAEYAALLHLAHEAELNVRRTGDRELHGAVVTWKEARHG